MSGTVFFEGTAELATVANVFTVDGTPTDPTTVTLTITDPTGASTDYTGTDVNHTGVGAYSKDIRCTIAGTWTYEWTGTTQASDVVVGTWEVHETQLGHLYCTVEMLKSRFKDTRNTDDLEYHSSCFAASRALEYYCGRTFYRSPEVRTLVPYDGYCLRLPEFHDLVSVNALKTDAVGNGVFGTSWATTDYQLLTDDGLANIYAGPEAKPYTQIAAVGSKMFPAPSSSGHRDVVQIDGVWGWPSVPWAIKQAAAMIAAETFKLKDSAGMALTGYDDFDQSLLGAEARRRFARFANPYKRRGFLVA